MEKFHYGENLKKIRLSKQLTQEKIALELDVAQRTYSRWERQAKVPKMAVVIKTSAYFKIPEQDLLPPNGVLATSENQAFLDEKLANFLTTPLHWILFLGATAALCEAVFQVTRGICESFALTNEISLKIACLTGILTLLYIINKIAQVLLFRKRNK